MAVSLTIDGLESQAQRDLSVLEAARREGITIPTLCYHKDLSPVGSCRLCLVEVEGWRTPAAACTLAITPGMVVRTDTPALHQARRQVLELLLQNYHEVGLDSTDSEFMHWVRLYEARLPAGLRSGPRYRVDSDPNPFIRIDMNQCILCTRCVRACAEIQGRFVWGVSGRGADSRIAAGVDTPLLEARCESCGACVAYCPTGALSGRMSFSAGAPDRRVSTTCTYCGVGCQFDLLVKDGKIIGVGSNPQAPVNGMHLCVKGRFGYDFIHHPDRLMKPKVRQYLLSKGRANRPSDRGPWIDVDWDTALEIAANKLASTRDAYGPDSIGVLTSAKCLNEENYLMNKFARQVVGTNNIDHCARL
jgi:formate dehydrogenase major subunit/formate dehydrogenase alpha subunit